MNNIKEKIWSKDWRTRAFKPLLLLLCLIAITLYSALVIGFQSMGQKKVVPLVTRPNPFDAVSVEAKSAIVWDVVNHRVLFEKNADTPRPLASLTKVMTAVTASSISPDLKNVTIELADLAPEGDSKLKVASNWSVKNLTDYVLLVSSNDGAHALASASVAAASVAANAHAGYFVQDMNTLAGSIGLSNSTFRNEHGLDTGEKESGAYGSARDMALLFEYTIKNYPHLLEATRYPNLHLGDQNSGYYLAKNTNEIINSIPSPIASKTGYTELAGGNLVVAFDAGLARPIIISVLGSTEQGRFEDMLKLVAASMLYLKQE